MRVVAFNGSSRKNGNTAILLKHALRRIENEGIKTELIQLAGKNIKGCCACGRCFSAKNKRCSMTSDKVNEYIAKMLKAEGIILGSPTYFADCTSQMKALIERAGMVARANNDMLKRKAGAAVVSVRRGGAIHAFDSMNHFFTIGQMITVGSSYWNIGIGRNPGEVEKDIEGISTMETLGSNMAWLIKKIIK